MKVDFNVYFKDYDGGTLTINGKPQCIGRIISQCLFNGTSIKPSGNIQMDNEKKLQAYGLCIKIMNSDSEINITSEDAVLIKEAIEGLTPGCYSQIVELIEK